MAEANPKPLSRSYDPVPVVDRPDSGTEADEEGEGDGKERGAGPATMLNGRAGGGRGVQSRTSSRRSSYEPLVKSKHKKCPATWKVAVLLMLACALFVAGLLLGYYIRHLNDDKKGDVSAGGSAYQGPRVASCGGSIMELLKEDPRNLQSRHENLMWSMSGDKMASYLWDYSDHMVYSGGNSDNSQAGTIRSFFDRFGLRSKEIPAFNEEYDTLLSYPNSRFSNTVQVLNKDGQAEYQAKIPKWADSYDPFGGFDFDSGRRRRKRSLIDDLQPFVAYSPPGQVQAELVNLNYGRREDIDAATVHSILLQGKIALMKLGHGTVESKVELAEAIGLAGILFYLDPQDEVSPDAKCDDRVPFANANDGRRGDPLTEGFPAIEGTARPDMKDVKLPRIPMQTISCSSAIYMLSRLSGQRAPPTWSGAINITHHIGRKSDRQPEWTVKLQTFNTIKPKTIQNIFGTVPGTTDPDHYVIVGASRNCFARGPESNMVGTSMLLEFGRNLQMLMNREAWKPKRTIKLVSWGGGEYGNIGMTEFIEQYGKRLQGRVLAYIDFDMPVLGKEVVNVGVTTTGLTDILNSVASRVPNPDNQQLMMFDNWAEDNTTTDDVKKHLDLPQLDDLYKSSRRIRGQPIADRFGIPAIHIQYTDSEDIEVPKDQEHESDTMTMMEAHHHFRFHTAVARLNGLLALSLADAEVVQYNVSRSARKLLEEILELEKIKNLPIHNATTKSLITQSNSLDQTAHAMQFFVIHKANFDDIYQRRLLNERLLEVEPLIEKAFACVMRLRELIAKFKYFQSFSTPQDTSELQREINLETNTLLLHIQEAEQIFKTEIS